MALGPPQYPQVSLLGPVPKTLEMWYFDGPHRYVGFSTPTRKLHFRTHHTRSFLLIYIQPWCKDRTMAVRPPQDTQLFLLDLLAPPLRRGTFTARTGKWGFGTD